jgi:exodeoxyribonuclease-3
VLKLISWNVNGLRACLQKGFMDAFRAFDADIVCLQETKMLEGQAELELGGYSEYWNSAEKKGYSGTAVFSRAKPLSASYAIGLPAHDREGRIISLEYDRFTLVNVYAPNSRRGLARLDYRMEWEDDVREWLASTSRTSAKPLIICGDMNVAHEEIDIKNAKSNRRNAGFTDEERGKMTALLDAGFCDTYRHLHPDQRDAYTWWSYMANARERNIGWRIDYFIVSRELIGSITDAAIYSDVRGSDHCPIGLALELGA